MEKKQKKSTKDTKNINKEISKEKEEKVKKENKVVVFLNKHAIIPYTIIGIALFMLAMMLVAQIKTVSNTEEVLQGKRETELSEELIKLQDEYKKLNAKYEESEKIVEEYKTNSSSNNELISSMKSAIETYSILAGATDVTGEGIILTLKDGDSISDGSDVLVHDSDVLTVVNELKAAGAEAISVNDQRIIATTAIRCVGPVIQINYQKAIGNAQYLESAMTIKNGVVDVLKKLGIGVTLERTKNLQIPKFTGTFSSENTNIN